MVAAVIPTTRQEWARIISAQWQTTVKDIIKTGQLVIDCKAALPHGEFELMVRKDLKWSPRTAQRLMAIAAHPVLTNATHGPLLPSSWRTLYELSRLPEPRLEWAIREGHVTPDMQRKDVAALKWEQPPEEDEPESITCTVSDLQVLVDKGIKFGTVYADPPWQYGNQGTRAATNNHYATMSLDAIAALPVPLLAQEKSHLHLWTTNGFISEALELIRAWGFIYKSLFVWVKPEMGIGNYWRVSHELMLLGVRGNCHFNDRSQKSWIETSRSAGHSSKPANVRGIIEKVSSNPRLELFGREAVKGWVVWGNEISRGLFTQSVEELV